MRITTSLILFAALGATALAQPVQKFRDATRISYSWGDNAPGYNNSDANIRVEIRALILGTQLIETTGGVDELAITKQAGSLNYRLNLSQLNPLLPNEFVTLVGTDLGGNRVRHVVDETLPGPYLVEGTFEGVFISITVRNVRVTGTQFSTFSDITPVVNPILNALCDVQFDDAGDGPSNTLSVVPGQVSGYIINPIFQVTSARIDITKIEQAGQVEATAAPETVAPDALTLQRGQIISGTIADLATDNGVALRLKKFFVANPVEPFVWGTLQGTTAILTPSSVTFRVKSRMVTGGQFRQELEQWNWNTSSYENLLNTNPFNTVYGTRESVASPATGKVNGSGRLQARIRTFPNGISANPLPEVDWDLVNWIVNP
ncbi:MAG: hypothetical protein KIS64_10985 [Fimbriimonadaceae bacterium]|nr:hypothetical protein [Fimbriimonadaceae bacterium]